MAKGYAKKVANLATSGNGNGNHHKALELTMSNGIKVKVVGVSHMYFEEVQNSVKFPDKPTYGAETAGGEIEYHAIDQTVVDDPTNTPEEKAEYAAKLAEYNEAFAAAQKLQSDRVNDFLFLKGVEYDIPDQDIDDWADERAMFGLEVSDKPRERKLQYIKSRVVSNVQDYGKLLNAIMESTGVSEESLAQAKELFPNLLEEA